MRYAVLLAVVFAFPFDAHGQNFVSRLGGPVACYAELSPLPPHALVQSDGSVSSFQPLTRSRRCAAPIEGWSAAGLYRAEQDWFQQSLSGDLSFAVLPGYRGGLGSIEIGLAHASFDEQIVVAGGSGSGVVRMRFRYTASASHAGAVAEALSSFSVNHIDFGSTGSWHLSAPGEIVADLPFTFGRPLAFRWQLSVVFRLSQVEFGPGEGGSGTFSAGASLLSLQIIPAAGPEPTNITVTGAGGIRYPTGPAEPDLAVTALSNPPPTLQAGDTMFVVDTTANGSTSDAAASETQYYLSRDGAERSYAIGSRLVAALSAGAGSVGDSDLSIPLTVVPGDYYLLACADATAVISESDEENNCRASATQVSIVGRTPVVVIPGILGTSLFGSATSTTNDHLWLDIVRATLSWDDEFLLRLALNPDGSSLESIRTGALFSIGPFLGYDPLLAALRQDGYRDGIDLFVFPYDWRRDNRIAAGALAQFIETVVVPQSGREKVDLVVHSMGGLIARGYASTHGDGRIGKVIYLGTPHDGSAKSFALLAFDYSLATFADVPFVLNAQTMATVSSTFPAVYQLLPRQPFITSVARGELLGLDESYAQAPTGFLRSAPSVARWVADADAFGDSLVAAAGPHEFNIVGTGVATLAGLRVFGDPSAVQPRGWCPTALDGDGTVTIGSSTAHGVTNVYVAGVTHDRLPRSAVAGNVVLSILRNDFGPLPVGASWAPSGIGPMFGWCTGSPVRVSITDEEGRMAGLNAEGAIAEAIPGSSFFTFEHNEGGFLRGDGSYQFSVSATSTGVFDLTIEQRNADGVVDRAMQFVDVPVAAGWSGRLAVGPDVVAPVLEIDANADGAPDFAVAPGRNVPPATSIAMLRKIVASAGLNRVVSTVMLTTLRVAGELLERGNRLAARLVLVGLSAYLQAQSGKHVPAAFAAEATTILDAILRGISG